ncbi:MAG: TetR/AcrR family transcriptional regulator [Corynebacterium humireducens]|uniref:TetR/AcrR family transcriptional regulator n=1 Tax=Corynebacterium humireducens TaxID=1223514 RepID=A0A7X6SVS0_9CORY|nr:TetR/AcrR family transcriptional regulator [Corynebacterium humireducens]
MSYHYTEREDPKPVRTGPGRPPNEALDRQVIIAARRLIREGKPLTIQEIVEASGASRSAIYRRWPSLNELLADALDHGRTNRVYSFDGPIKPILEELLFDRMHETVGRGYTDKHYRRHLELMMANPQLQKVYWEKHASRRLKCMQRALQAAKDNGEIRRNVDIEAALDAIYGVRTFQTAVRGVPFDSPEAVQRARAAFDLLRKGMEP